MLADGLLDIMSLLWICVVTPDISDIVKAAQIWLLHIITHTHTVQKSLPTHARNGLTLLLTVPALGL